MGFNCFWVSGECVAEAGAYTCRGCRQYPYGQAEVAPPGVPADVGQQILGIHMGIAELLLKKEIAKPEEVDEAIGRNVERLANQDRMLHDAIVSVDHVLDCMVRVPEPGKLSVYVALDEEGLADRDAVTGEVSKAVRGMIPPGLDVSVIVAEPRPAETEQAPSKKTKPAPKKAAGGAKTAKTRKGAGAKSESGKAAGVKSARTPKAKSDK